MKQKPIALIVDDDVSFLLLLEKILSSCGFRTITTSDEKSFMNYAVTFKPSIAFVDLNINYPTSGFTIVENFREKVSRETPVIMLSSTEDCLAMTYALEFGATDFVNKSVGKEYFKTKISTYITTKDLQKYISPSFNIEENKQTIDILLNCKIVSIDEIGIYFEGPHLLSNGMKIKLQIKELKEFSDENGFITLEVVSSIIANENNSFMTFAEFDMSSETSFIKIRNWLKGSAKETFVSQILDI